MFLIHLFYLTTFLKYNFCANFKVDKIEKLVINVNLIVEVLTLKTIGDQGAWRRIQGK